MSRTLLATKDGAGLLSRVFDPEKVTFSAEAARSLLTLDFGESDREQMNALAAKARDGTLTIEEQQALDNYLFVGNILDIMHSKSRLYLRTHISAS